MKVIQWNITRQTGPMTGEKRYEDEIYRHIKEIGKDIEVKRVQRIKNTIAGNAIGYWFWWACKPRNADIVHATVAAIAPVALIRKPKRFIVTVLDLIPLVFPSVWRDYALLGKAYILKILIWKLEWFFIPAAIKKADRIITISEFSKGEVSSLLGIDKSKIYVTPLAVDRTKYYPKDKLECRKKFNLKADKKYILVVASNLEHKRMDMVEKVFNSIREKRKDISLIKAGYAQKLSGEGIINIGYVNDEDMPDLYNSADVFINTSSYETGLPILEAMSCGVPMVVSNSASNLEIVGQHGQIVNINADNAIEQYVDKILSCIDSGRDDSAIERSKSFSWERMASETINVYKGLIQEEKR